jgi:nucleoside-diphosphate-sugar epimerase
MSKTVAVTGATGYVASVIIQTLLQQGYTVHGTVRSLQDPSKHSHLRTLDGADDRLRLFEADLLTGGFDLAFQGCVGVFHTASPFLYNVKDPEKDLLIPALQGTRNVLEAVVRTPSVKKVVLTSSTVSIYMAENQINMTEEDWSREEVLIEKKMFYPLSKTRAEKFAWDFHKDHQDKFDMVVVNPTFVLGTMLQPTLNTSSELLLLHLNGTKKKLFNATFTIVDVHDVAQAHLLAYEKPMKGRLINIGHHTNWKEMCEVIKRLRPEANVPTELEDTPFIQRSFDTSKSVELGVKYTDLEVTIRDSIDSLIKFGFYKPV